MGGDVNNMELLRLSPGSDAADHDEWMQRILKFDVRNAVAFSSHDRERLLAMITAGFLGPDRFNTSLREVLALLANRARADAIEDSGKGPRGKRGSSVTPIGESHVTAKRVSANRAPSTSQ